MSCKETSLFLADDSSFLCSNRFREGKHLILFRSPVFSICRCSSSAPSSLSLQSRPEFSPQVTSPSVWVAPPDISPCWVREKTKVFHMQQDEAPPRIDDKVLFRSESCLLDFIQACGKEKDLERITRVHVDLLVEALIPKDVCITIALLIAYTKCGAMREARRLFQGVNVRNVTAWNALIAGYARNHLGDEAVKCFMCMQDKDITPNAVTFICISKACASIGDIEMGHVIYAEAQKWDLLSRDIMLGNALIDMYTRFGLMQRAQEVFEKIPVKNVVTWTSLIGGYARLELATLAIECFREMLSAGCPPDTVTLFWVLKACDSIGCSELPEEIYDVVRDEKALDGAIGRMLVDVYSRYDATAKA